MTVNVNVAISEKHWRLLAKIRDKLGFRNQNQTVEKIIDIAVDSLSIGGEN